MDQSYHKNLQYYKFSFYGFLKNLRFFESFLILFFLEKELTYVEIGFLYSIRSITIVLTEIPSGAVADALGRRRTLLLSFFVYLLSFFTFYFSNSFISMAIAMVLFALADAFRSGVHKAMIFHYLQQKGWSSQKTDYYGHTRSWSQRGSALSALVAGAIVFYSGSYRVIFLASVLPYLLDMLLIASYPKWLDGTIKNLDVSGIRQKFIQVEQGFVLSFKQPHFLKSLINTSIYTGYFKAVKDYVQPVIKMFALSIPAFAYLNNDKKTALFVGLFYFVIYLLTAWMSRRSGDFKNIFKNYTSPMNLTLLIGFGSGVLSGLIFLTGWYSPVIIGFVLIMMVENLRKPIGVSMIAELSHDDAMATVLSLTSQVKSVFAAVIAPLIGMVADKFGPGAGIATVSLLLLLLFPLIKLNKSKTL